mgnify:CR=1 FL=1
MKKLLSFVLMCLMVLSMNAQRCAVLEFKAGVGISQADVDGISAVFINEGMPQGERLQKLNQIAIQQMTVPENVESKHILKG